MAAKPRKSAVRTDSFRPILAQLAMTIVGALTGFLMDPVVGYSILLGGLCCVVPGAFAAYRMSLPTVQVSEAASHVAKAQVGKFALTVCLLIVVFSQVEPLSGLFFFGTMAVVQLAYVVEPLLHRQYLSNLTRN